MNYKLNNGRKIHLLELRVILEIPYTTMDKISYATFTQVVLCVLPLYCDSRSLTANLNYDIINAKDYVADVFKSEVRHYITDDKKNFVIKPQKQKNEKSNRKYVKQNIKTRKQRSIIPQKLMSQPLMLAFQQKNTWDQNTKLPHTNNEYHGIETPFFKDDFLNDIAILTALKSLERAPIKFPREENVLKEKAGLLEKGAWSQETQSEYIDEEEEHEGEALSKTTDEAEEPENGTFSKDSEEDEEQEGETLGKEAEGDEYEEYDDEEEEDKNEEDEYEDDEEEEHENKEYEDEENDVPFKTIEEDEEQENEPHSKNTEINEEQEDETTLSEDIKEVEKIIKIILGHEKQVDEALDKNNKEDEETVRKSTQDYKNKILRKNEEGDREHEVKTLSKDTKNVVDVTDKTLNKLFKEDKEQNVETHGKDTKGFEEQEDKILGKGGEGYEQDDKTFCIYTGGSKIEDKNCFTTLVLKSILSK